MLKINEKIVYRNDVCKVIDIVKKFRNDEDYYLLTPVNDTSLTIHVPISNSTENIRPLITKSEIEELIHKINEIPVIPISNMGRGAEYKELLSNGSHESLITVIKTAYQRKQMKAECNQKPSESDKQYFRQAEKLLYNEIGAVLNMSFDKAKEYIVDKVSQLEENNSK